MPMYTFKCESCDYQTDYYVKMDQREVPCKKCRQRAVYQLSFKTVSTGLPNGHIGIKNIPR